MHMLTEENMWKLFQYIASFMVQIIRLFFDNVIKPYELVLITLQQLLKAFPVIGDE